MSGWFKKATLTLTLISLIKIATACECEGKGFWQTVVSANSIVIAQITNNKTTEHSAGQVVILNEIVGSLGKTTINFGHTECSENLDRYSVGDSLLLVPSFDAYYQRWVLETCEASIMRIKNGIVTGQFTYPVSISNESPITQSISLQKVINILYQYQQGYKTANHKLFSSSISNARFLSNYPVAKPKPIDFNNSIWIEESPLYTVSGMGGTQRFSFVEKEDTLDVRIDYSRSFREFKVEKKLFRKDKFISNLRREEGFYNDTFYHWANHYYKDINTNTSFDIIIITSDFLLRVNQLKLTTGTFLSLGAHDGNEVVILEKPYTSPDSMEITFINYDYRGLPDKQDTYTIKKVRLDTNSISLNEDYRCSLVTYEYYKKHRYSDKYLKHKVFYIPKYDLLVYGWHYYYVRVPKE